MPRAKPYMPLFMILTGKKTEPPKDGFGTGYDGAFFAAQLVRVRLSGNCKSELIYLDSPMPGALVTSPLKIRGHARGTWFFEGDFPMALEDSKGNIIARGFCTAKTDWMTKDFVRFEGIIAFDRPTAEDKGTLILKKDYPTGLPKHDDALKVPVFLK